MERLATDCAVPAFREGGGPRRPPRRVRDLDALGAEDRIEAVGELGVPVVDEEPERADALPEVDEQVAGLLRDPGAGVYLAGAWQACLQESLTIYQQLGDSRSEASSLHELGMALQALGRSADAQARWRQALAIYERLQATHAATQVRTLLAAPPSPTSLQVKALQGQGRR